MAKKPPPPPEKVGPEDDKRLWKLVASTVKPRAPEKPEKMRSKARIRPVKTATALPLDPPTRLVSIAPLRVAPEELKPAPAKTLRYAPDRIEPNRKRRIAKEHDPIGARLDMHGLDQDQARAMLEGFIRRAYEDGHRAVLVITGKGKIGHGVLRQRTPEWLAGPAVREMIAGVSTADQRHGGEGALYVALKRKG